MSSASPQSLSFVPNGCMICCLFCVFLQFTDPRPDAQMAQQPVHAVIGPVPGLNPLSSHPASPTHSCCFSLDWNMFGVTISLSSRHHTQSQPERGLCQGLLFYTVWTTCWSYKYASQTVAGHSEHLAGCCRLPSDFNSSHAPTTTASTLFAKLAELADDRPLFFAQWRAQLARNWLLLLPSGRHR